MITYLAVFQRASWLFTRIFPEYFLFERIQGLLLFSEYFADALAKEDRFAIFIVII